MQLKVEKETSLSAWDEVVRACSGTVFHSSAWARYTVRARRNTSAVHLRLTDAGGRLVGAALGFRTRSPRRLLAPVTSRLWFDALPSMQPGLGDASGQFIAMIEGYARHCRDVEVAFGSYAYQGGSEHLRSRGYVMNERIEFELDLAPGEDELWRALEHKRRKNVNKSRRAGVVVEEMPLDLGLDELWRLHEMTWDRIEKRGVQRKAGQRYTAADAPERELVAAGVGHLVGARLGDEWLTASLFTRFGDRVYHVLSGHSPRALELQAPTQLLWESIVRFRVGGARWFNFGGCAASAREPSSPEHGVYDYKRAFGGAALECGSGYRVLRPARAALARAVRRFAGH